VRLQVLPPGDVHVAGEQVQDLALDLHVNGFERLDDRPLDVVVALPQRVAVQGLGEQLDAVPVAHAPFL